MEEPSVVLCWMVSVLLPFLSLCPLPKKHPRGLSWSEIFFWDLDQREWSFLAGGRRKWQGKNKKTRCFNPFSQAISSYQDKHVRLSPELWSANLSPRAGCTAPLGRNKLLWSPLSGKNHACWDAKLILTLGQSGSFVGTGQSCPSWGAGEMGIALLLLPRAVLSLKAKCLLHLYAPRSGPGAC